MAALQQVGSGSSVAMSIAGFAQTTGYISQQSDTVRVFALDGGVHVAIGTDPSASNTDFYLAANTGQTFGIGNPSSQRVVGVTTSGNVTHITFPEGTGSPFVAGDIVSLSVTGQSYYDFDSAGVISVESSSGVHGYFSQRITVDNRYSVAISTAVGDLGGDLRNVFKVSAIPAPTTDTGGAVYVQQVQITGDA